MSVYRFRQNWNSAALPRTLNAVTSGFLLSFQNDTDSKEISGCECECVRARACVLFIVSKRERVYCDVSRSDVLTSALVT